jgi:hypothetical protein
VHSAAKTCLYMDEIEFLYVFWTCVNLAVTHERFVWPSLRIILNVRINNNNNNNTLQFSIIFYVSYFIGATRMVRFR